MRARIFAATGALALAALLVVGASAGSAGQMSDLSSSAIVKQVGLLNYAGPSCPGLGWNCTTATNVVQVASAGGQNRFECEPEDDQVPPTDEDSNTCAVSQSGANNHARCKLRNNEEPTAEQTCTVTQNGTRNSADIDMTIDQKSGPTQEGRQTATVDQTATERNQTQVHQTIKQRTSTGTSQSQEAYQLADVRQNATGSANFSHVHQSQDQDESGNATTQSQNTDVQPPCAGKDANQCALVLQTSGGGENESHLHQAIGERQSTKATFADQMQGTAANGNEGTVHQQNPDGVGQNHDHAHQTVAQRQSGPNGTTSQMQNTDPRCCGGGSQVGGEQNREDIHQETTQSASEREDANQFSTLFGEVHQVSDPANKCRIDHHARNNADSSHESVSGEDLDCTSLVLETTCFSGGEGGDCMTFVPCDDCFAPPILSVPTSATLGRDIAMPNYGSEPSEYTDPGGWW